MVEWVIDASVAVKWVIEGEPLRSQARQLLHDALADNIGLIGPPLLDYEFESVLQRLLYLRQAPESTIDASLAAYYAVGVQAASPPGLVPLAREIARQFNQPRIYDSLYAALAKLRGCEFWTADKAFHKATRPQLNFVRFLADYP